MTANEVVDSLLLLRNDERATFLQRFFKTGKGQYAEGDLFWGITVPELRTVAIHYTSLSHPEVGKLILDSIHEVRMVGLLILTYQMKKAKSESEKKSVFDVYKSNIEGINNWDLVDVSAPIVIGGYLFDKSRQLLYELADSGQLWKQRISIISTLHFIKKNDFEDTLRLADKMVQHPHDLMHKAIGWMLREIGKKNRNIEKDFLKSRYGKMPRTMLRYAIEHFPEEERQGYLRGTI